MQKAQLDQAELLQLDLHQRLHQHNEHHVITAFIPQLYWYPWKPAADLRSAQTAAQAEPRFRHKRTLWQLLN